MNLTLNQFLLLVLTIAIVAFLAYLIPAIRQLKETARRAEEVLKETKQLISNFQETERLIKSRIEEVDDLIKTSKKTLTNISEIAFFISKKLLKPSTRYVSAILPLINLGWKLYKKRKKGGKNEQQ
jgi:predicted PurR-regulated permease PerM